MLFNTVEYILFLPVVVVLYYLLPAKARPIWLLGISYYFYMQWDAKYVLLLFFCTLATYVGGLFLERFRDRQESDEEEQQKNIIKRKSCFMVCLLANLGILAFFKYSAFGVSILNQILSFFHVSMIPWNVNILLPVGISFYTLQALGYLIDVYRGDIYAEKNFIHYALFVSFFPQLVAGPIERSKNLLVQLHRPQKFTYENLRKGLLLILYGLFLKMVIADRAAILVDKVYGNPAEYSGVYIIVATVFFSIQIYCDFYGYSTIARGSAMLMGIRLMDNFDAPYFSKSVQEFWRRWHISRSGWFRDYLYIPLGGNKKGSVRKEGNRMIVFAVSGLWHGASLSFVLWGVLNGIYQVAEDLAERLGEKFLNTDRQEMLRKTACFSKRLFRTVFTFVLIAFAWLFFRSGGVKESIVILGNMRDCSNWLVLLDGSLFELGVGRHYMGVLLLSILVLFLVDYQKYRGRDVADLFLKQGWWFRTAAIMGMIYVILLYGIYGKIYDIQQFIYFQF